MKLYLVVGSINDIITNSSTEILSIRTEHTPEILKEIILNYAMCYDKPDYIDPDSDLIITKIDTLDEINKELYGGTLSQEECNIFKEIICRRYGCLNKSGELYMITIDHGLYNTINFLTETLGAV